LVFRKTGKIECKVSIDAAFGVHRDGKSQSGYVAMMSGASMESKSKKQSLVAKNSTEAELIALSDMVSLAIAREFVIGQGYTLR
jgi:hypothetical protein